MLFVYILKSQKDGSYYVGLSDNYERRLAEHNAGKVKSTKSRTPWVKVHLDEFYTRLEAREREKYLKSAAGRRYRKFHLGLN